MDDTQKKIKAFFEDYSSRKKFPITTGNSALFRVGKDIFGNNEMKLMGKNNKFTKEGLVVFRRKLIEQVNKISDLDDEASKDFILNLFDDNSDMGKFRKKFDEAQHVGRPLKDPSTADDDPLQEKIIFTPKKELDNSDKETTETVPEAEPSEPKIEIIEEKPKKKESKTNSIRTAKSMVGVLSNRVNNLADTVEEIHDAGEQIAQGQQAIAQAGHALVSKLNQPKKKKIDDLFLEAEASGKPFVEFLNDIDKSEYDIPMFDKPSILKKRFEEYQFSKQMSTLSKYGSIPDELLNQMVESGELNSDQLLRIQEAKNKIQEIQRREAAKDYVRLEFPTAHRERKIKLIDHGINPALLRRP